MELILRPNMQQFFQNKNILVTGAAGFIGSHLCEQLLQRQAKVIGVDNFLTGSKDNIEAVKTAVGAKADNFTFIEADVNQEPANYLPADLEISAILHFASPASPDKYQQHPKKTYLVNSWATHLLLSYLLAVQPQARLLFASTSEVYGDPLQHPQDESYWGNVNPNGPRSCYDEAKRMGEAICGVHARDFNLDVRIVRIFNTYGPRMDINDGRVVPNFIKAVLLNQKFQIYGTGEQTRSFCYVDELVEGILLALSTDGLKGETINLGNPVELTVLETAKTIKQAVGQELQKDDLVYKPLPVDDPTRRKPDISKAKKLLAWEPKINFKDGLEKTVHYFQNKEIQSSNKS